MSRSAPRSLSPALTALTGELVPQSALARIQGVWDRVAGPAVAAAATPRVERDGTLTVACSAAVWAQELELMAPVLLERLNEALGGELVHKLRCQVQ